MLSLSTEEWEHIRDVQCPVCCARYHIWAPIVNIEQAEIAVHVDWLSQHLMNNCTGRTLGRLIRPPDTEHICLKKLVPKPSTKAENAGLRGPERETFIREHTEFYYAELLMERSWVRMMVW